MSKIYIAGALTGVEESKKIIYTRIGSVCEDSGFDPYVPHQWSTDPTKNPEVPSEAVWSKNQNQITSSKLMIAYVGTPSLGVGAELEIARINNKKIILWWYRGEVVSRMALGNPGITEKIEAKNEIDLLKKINELLKNYEK